jgi:hypothetical protein
MDWKQIEDDFIKEFCINNDDSLKSNIVDWFKDRIESAQIVSVEKLTEEEKSEFYTTNLTADIKAKYGK